MISYTFFAFCIVPFVIEKRIIINEEKQKKKKIRRIAQFKYMFRVRINKSANRNVVFK